tara:strand:+ start:887 stop:1828 length:942 start_codon:yes stop_codon:yes gene_type:complete
MKALFITSTRIGDAVLSTSVLNYIIKIYPGSSVYLATGEDPSSLFRDFQNVKKIYILKKKKFKFHWFELWYQAIFFQWDLVVDLRGSMISHFLYAKKKYIYKSNNKYLHILDEFSSLLRIKRINYPSISINKKILFKAKKNSLGFRNIIAIGASANWPAKVWPAKKFAKLIKLLLKNNNFGKNATIVFFGSSKDTKDTKKIINFLKNKNIKNLCGGLNLLEVYAYIKQCKIFIGNDSGLMHIAAASGICTLGLFGPSLESRYAPKGKKAYFIRTKKSYKSLTGNKNFDWNTKKNLMNSLSVSMVYKKICKILK